MTAVPCFCSRVGIVLLLSCVLAFANDPGGGTNGVGANVTLTPSGGNVILANGVLSATITTNNAKITSMTYGGRQLVSGDIYFSMDGGTSYEQPGSCVYTIKTNTTDMVDVSFKCLGASRIHKFDIDVHYVLRRGDSGIYVYAQLSHPANYPDTGVGEWRMVWKMSQDQTERIYVDDIRNWQKPSSYDLANSQATGIAEVARLTTGAWSNRYTCKYMYSAEYENVGCYGHASNTNKFGVWAVLGGYDYFNDGPTKQDLAPADGIIHIHFGRNHYNASSTSVATNETWSKIYGPWLLYCNTNAAGGDACWADAKAQVQAEKDAWPYTWLTGNTNYPAANGRGTLTGKFIVSDALKPALAAGTNTWVGLAQPEAGGNWQFESKRYQYWVHPDAAGNFVIPSLRPGTYTLYAFTPGAVGEYTHSNSIVITAATTNALGNVTWNVPHPGGQIAWEIGIPDRTAKEFRHGTNYWEPFLWNTISNEWSNPLEYNVATSNWTNDWNYVQPGYLSGSTWSGWKWRINFVLTNLPTSGSATLTLAWAGSDSAAIQVFVNNESSVLTDFYPATTGGPSGGNAHIREGIHAKYGVNYVSVPLSALNLGANTITLVERRTGSATEHVMYDYVSLELPAQPVLPPGQSLIWRGGNNANAWDIGTTANWVATNGAPSTFADGDNVLFDNSGYSNATVSVGALMLPGSVSVISASNYTFTGTGALNGPMNLIKAGSGTLTVNNTNGYGGQTWLSSGKIVVGVFGALGTGPLVMDGGTVQLNNGGTLANAVNVVSPSVVTTTGNSYIQGAISGASTLTVTSGNVLTFESSAAGFYGTVAMGNSTGYLRFNQSGTQGVPNGVVDAGTNTAKIENRLTGAGTIRIGALKGGPNTKLLGTDQGANPGSIDSYIIGGLNTDSTFEGAINNTGHFVAITKVGTGTWTLSGSNSYSGVTAVGAGTLQVSGSITTTNFLVVSNAATLDLSGVITALRVQINAGGTLTGCGTINGDLLNNGTVITACGAPGNLTINGSVTNNGAMQFLLGSGLQVSGTFVNNGLLDLLTGAQGLPAGLINNGVVLDSSNVFVQSVALVGADLQLQIQSYAGHNYQLQRTASLSVPDWQNLGASQEGSDAVLTFTDTGVTSGVKGFYRIAVAP